MDDNRQGILCGLLLAGILIACEKNTDLDLVDESGYVIEGMVLDSASHTPIAGVRIGLWNPFDPDSLFFIGDSLTSFQPYESWMSSTDGSFRIAHIGSFEESFVHSMYAWKSGYHLWRYDQRPMAITTIGDGYYEITILLVNR